MTVHPISLILGALCLLALGYAHGGTRVTREHYAIVDWTVGSNRRLATKLRALYDALGYEYDDEDEDEPPRRNWWIRTLDRIRGWWNSTPERIEPEMRATEPEANDAHDDEPEPAADTQPEMPAVRPQPAPGPSTVPAAAVIASEWGEIDAMYREAMAAIEAAGGGKAK